MPTSVKYFNYQMSGAPAANAVAGNSISILDACLVNGFGSVTLDSLVVASNVATATVSTGHNFPMIVGVNALTPGVGPVIRIEGATPAGLNGDWRIASVPNTTTFTFATTGIGDQTATGTITAKRAPAGFSKAYSGTNLAAYQADALTATRLFLRVNSTARDPSTVVMYETMSDINTGTGLSPTSGSYNVNMVWVDSNVPWHLFADDRCFYLFVDGNSSQPGAYQGQLFFGDLISLASTDQYHCGLIGSAYLTVLAGTTASSLARSYTQTGGSISFKRIADYISQQLIGNAGDSYPTKCGGMFLAQPIQAWESDSTVRGFMPGFYAPQHARFTMPSGTLINQVANYPGRQFLSIAANGYSCVFDIVGPWR